MVLLLFIFGVVIGSFLSAYTYRAPLGDLVSRGRSYCDRCKKQLVWYENVPLLSFIALRGKCSGCDKKISRRYPIIEGMTGLLFVLIGERFFNCVNLGVSQVVCSWSSHGLLTLPLLLVIASIFIAIFVIDYEHQIIPDELVFFTMSIIFFAYLLGDVPIYIPLLSGFSTATFLLLLNIFTFGKGMGLGDVKFAIPAGMVLSFPLSLVWMFLSFLMGAIVGLVLIASGKSKFGKHIPFGPFLVLSFFITLLYGEWLLQFFPYLY